MTREPDPASSSPRREEEGEEREGEEREEREAEEGRDKDMGGLVGSEDRKSEMESWRMPSSRLSLGVAEEGPRAVGGGVRGNNKLDSPKTTPRTRARTAAVDRVQGKNLHLNSPPVSRRKPTPHPRRTRNKPVEPFRPYPATPGTTRSPVWAHFTASPSGTRHCHHCTAIFSANSSTSTLGRHLRRHRTKVDAETLGRFNEGPQRRGPVTQGEDGPGERKVEMVGIVVEGVREAVEVPNADMEKRSWTLEMESPRGEMTQHTLQGFHNHYDHQPQEQDTKHDHGTTHYQLPPPAPPIPSHHDHSNHEHTRSSLSPPLEARPSLSPPFSRSPS